MTLETLFDRERDALGGLQRMVRDRAATEVSLVETFQAATDEADREVQKARKTIGAARKKFTDEAEATHQANMAAVNDKFGTQQQNADQKRQDARSTTVTKFSAALDKARTEFSDKLWTFDSIHEAGEKEAKDIHADLKRKADALTQRIETVWDKAEPVLAKNRQSREKVTFPAGQLPPPTETDPLGRAQKIVEDAETALEKLTNPPFPWNILGIILKGKARSMGEALGVYQSDAARAVRLLREYADDELAEKQRELSEKHATDKAATTAIYEPKIAALEAQMKATLADIDGKHAAWSEKNKAAWDAEKKKEADRHAKLMAEQTAKLDAELAAAEKRFADKTATATAARDATYQKMTADWFGGLDYVAATGRDMLAAADRFPPDWAEIAKPDTKLPSDAPSGIRYGDLHVELYSLPQGKPTDPKLVPAEPYKAKLPAYLPFPQGCSVLLKARDEGRTATIQVLQAMMLRFLTGVAPGKVRFTIVDPVGLGENFASFMHLADFDEKMVTNRIWTEPGQIEEQLEKLTEHMENVIQKYLRNQYKSIEEYNRAAGEVAEPYRVLVVANFPTNFTPDAARRLVSIMSSGPACGVCTLIGRDMAVALPRDFRAEDMEQVAYTLTHDGRQFKPEEEAFAPFPLTLDLPPAPKTMAEIVKKVGQDSLTKSKVEVPFDFIMPPAEMIWKGSAAKAFEVYVGRAGATRKQAFILGKGTSQHALVAGKTGSGKSTLLHALITNLALTYSPEEAEVYLIDFKKGVEFTTYATHRLPHARVIAIESEREFGLSVLQRLDKILTERGENYRAAGTNDLAGYRAARPNEVTPRILLLVDEFQEFFTEDDKLAQEAAQLMDRLVRQGRAFGVHLFCGSQTLGGAAALPRATIDQMAVRVALQSSEADAQLILSKDNTAARLLTRPGEAIYNDANGRVEGNNPFQVVYLSDERKEELLKDLRKRAEATGKDYPPPLVFEGSAPADITANRDLQKIIDAPAGSVPGGPPVFYLGDAIAIKPPTAAVLRPQTSANVLMLGQQEEGALGLMAAGLAGLAAKVRPGANGNGTGRTFTILDGTPDDSEFGGFLENAATALGLQSAMVDRDGMGAALTELSEELARRLSGEAERTPRFLIVHGLQRLRELKKGEDDFGFGKKDKKASPGDQFATLLRDGPPMGIHSIVWCDTLTNLTRALDRQALKEFTYRVLFQMSASDSSTLLDSPVASKLGKTRAMLAEEGAERPEKFRPYAFPPGTWLRKVGDQIAGDVAAEGRRPDCRGL